MAYPQKTFLFFIFSFLIVGNVFSQQADISKEMRCQAEEYRQKGWQAQQAGDMNSAISSYQKALYIDPSYACAFNDLGVIYEARGFMDRAKEMYTKAMEADPAYPSSYSNMALLYESQKDYPHAIVYWIKRSMVGSLGDPWTKVALKRLEQINQVHPNAFNEIDKIYGQTTGDIYPIWER